MRETIATIPTNGSLMSENESKRPGSEYMSAALDEARLAAQRNEVPVGAVVVFKGEIIARAGNRTLELNDPTAHAEILAVREACSKLQSQRLNDCDLYVTLEPCTMCAGALSFARLRRVYFGATDPKGGAVESGVKFYTQATCHHAPEVYAGIAETESEALLKDFFSAKR